LSQKILVAPGWRNPSNRSFSLKLCCTLPSLSHKAATSVQCLQTYAASCPVCEAFAVVLCLRFASSVVLFFLFCALGVGLGLCAVLRMLHQEVVDEHGWKEKQGDTAKTHPPQPCRSACEEDGFPNPDVMKQRYLERHPSPTISASCTSTVISVCKTTPLQIVELCLLLRKQRQSPCSRCVYQHPCLRFAAPQPPTHPWPQHQQQSNAPP